MDKLEYEVMQTKKVQDNINKLREKLKNLCKQKQGDSEKFKHESKCKPIKDATIAQMHDSAVELACQKVLHYAGLENTIDVDEFISELMDQASL